MAVSFYLYEYIQTEERPLLFYCIYLIILGALQGIFFAGHMIVLFAFLEAMTTAATLWVMYHKDAQALKAGYFYLYLGVTTGLFLAAGIAIIASLGGSLTVGLGSTTLVDHPMFSWAVVLFIAGFGIKAGMVPMHIWLPMAHPVAPTPSSALLSGILIKSGVYGMIRVAQLCNMGISSLASIDWLGTVITILGILTMLLG